MCSAPSLQPLTTEEVCELQARLSAAEQALAAKQQQIDEMKQDLFKKEKELETISVFQAQVIPQQRHLGAGFESS